MSFFIVCIRILGLTGSDVRNVKGPDGRPDQSRKEGPDGHPTKAGRKDRVDARTNPVGRDWDGTLSGYSNDPRGVLYL
ncbi:MAG: hypothetical protein OEW75_01410 [Cyclobacteriaceae bacterium]|nr:hypothetical protein [Cyclobacteriaceae bacterium]